MFHSVNKLYSNFRYGDSLDLLREAGWIKEMEMKPSPSNSLLVRPEAPPKRPSKDKGLAGIVNWLKEKQKYGPEYDYYRNRQLYDSVTLEPITQTSQAVFQVS